MKKTTKPTSMTVMHVASRSFALPDAAHVPEVPADHKMIDGPARLSLLKVYADQEAETERAMEELWTKRVDLQRALGPLAPEANEGKELLDRMVAARALHRKAQKLAAYADEQEALANHAVMAFLTSTVADIEHVATRKPGLTEEFALTLKVMEQRREAIVAGMARSKASKGAPEQATKAPDAAPTAPATPVNS